MSIEYRNIAANVKNLRKQLGLTQEDLGELVGVSQQAISKLEDEEGHRSIYIIEIADALGVNAHDLASTKGPVDRVASDTALTHADIKSINLSEIARRQLAGNTDEAAQIFTACALVGDPKHLARLDHDDAECPFQAQNMGALDGRAGLELGEEVPNQREDDSDHDDAEHPFQAQYIGALGGRVGLELGEEVPNQGEDDDDKDHAEHPLHQPDIGA